MRGTEFGQWISGQTKDMCGHSTEELVADASLRRALIGENPRVGNYIAAACMASLNRDSEMPFSMTAGVIDESLRSFGCPDVTASPQAVSKLLRSCLSVRNRSEVEGMLSAKMRQRCHELITLGGVNLSSLARECNISPDHLESPKCEMLTRAEARSVLRHLSRV